MYPKHLPLRSGYCCRNCLYNAVVVFFIKWRWCDLHWASGAQTYFSTRLASSTYEWSPGPLICWKTTSFLLWLGTRFSLQCPFTSFKTIAPPLTCLTKKKAAKSFKILGTQQRNKSTSFHKHSANIPCVFPKNWMETPFGRVCSKPFARYLCSLCYWLVFFY